ncbi:recombinase family protein [Streptosporangium sp. NPDC003464]
MHENLDTTTPGGRLVFHVFAALAEFIRELIVAGTREGPRPVMKPTGRPIPDRHLDPARRTAQGRHCGRWPTTHDHHRDRRTVTGPVVKEAVTRYT